MGYHLMIFTTNCNFSMTQNDFFLGFLCNWLKVNSQLQRSLLLNQMHIILFSSYNGYKLNSLLTCFQWGFIAQLVEHCTGITEVMGSKPIEASEFFLDFLYNCLHVRCFTTTKITFTCTIYCIFFCFTARGAMWQKQQQQIYEDKQYNNFTIKISIPESVIHPRTKPAWPGLDWCWMPFASVSK